MEALMLDGSNCLLPTSGVRPNNFRSFAGCLACRVVPVRAGSTQMVVRAVFNARRQGLDDSGGTRFYASCEAHGTLCGFRLAREAENAAFDPTAQLDFCEDCSALAREEEDNGNA